MHKALGTENRGAVRFSFSWFNSDEDVNRAVQAVKEIAS
jgi:cysteine sulfinate desulfinase/cysteine desulfurase-like protein